MTAPSTAPILSTPAEHIFQDPTPASIPSPQSRLSEEQLYIQYEIGRTVREIREGKWRRIALQFPDEMLVHAPRVFERLREDLRTERRDVRRTLRSKKGTEEVAEKLEKSTLSEDQTDKARVGEEEGAEKLCILADTSYGACCVDEVAAEHVDADVVVHYGRSCLSPTARLPVIHVFTSPPLDLDAVGASFTQAYPERDKKVCLMADIPYHHHVPLLYERLVKDGYTDIFATEILHNPSSLLPNRTVPPAAEENQKVLKDYSIFHISTPPTALLLILSSRVKSIHILPTDQATSTTSNPLTTTTTTALLKRRYALLTTIPAKPIIGILINTLSVKNYQTALQHCETLIRNAGKKSYTFVVGKVNAAKIANFAEIGAWVVIGCWESSLLESKDFMAPIVTPFELEVALQGDGTRIWAGEWVSDFSEVLGRKREKGEDEGIGGEGRENGGGWEDEDSDDEAPDFDLRTGKYFARSRPMGRQSGFSTRHSNGSTAAEAPPSSALVQRAKGDVATINGAVSPGAEFLRAKRTWQGLGSDYEIAYERDDEGRIRGTAIEEGRRGVARGYAVGGDTSRS